MKNRSLVVIDRSAIIHNAKRLKQVAGAGKRFLAVIKQDAYGHGAIRTALLLHDQADQFVVACIEEAIQLRNSGINKPVIVLEPFIEQNIPAYRTLQLTAVVSEIEQVELLDGTIVFHIEFNTGMNRIGISPDLAGSLAARLAEKKLQPEAIFSHFASTAEKNPALTRHQLEQFKAVFHHFDASVWKHAGNSEAVFQFSDGHFDAIRPGVALFGEGGDDTLKPAMFWVSYVMQSRFVNRGDGVSYGWSWVADHPGWISTIPVGYAEGYPRINSNKTIVCVDGKWFPQVGIVTMDYLIANTGTFLAPNGAPVWLLSPDFTTADLARHAGTIPYEIMCSVGNRNKRLYIDSLNDGFQFDVEDIVGVEADSEFRR